MQVSPASRKGRISGFTILELLTATAVFLLMAMLLVTAISQMNLAWANSNGQKNRQELGRSLLDLLARDLQGTVPPLAGVGTNAVDFTFESGGATDSDSLFWLTSFAPDRGKSDIATIGYYVNGSNQLCRLYTNAPWPDVISKVGGTNAQSVLADGIVRMDVTLYDKDGTTAVTSKSYRTNLPASVEITLAIADDRTLLRNPGLTVPDLNEPPKGVGVYRTRIDLPCSP
jgi:type II secretory pathway component PulJ